VTGPHTICKKSVWECCCETSVCKTCIHHILQSEKMARAKGSVEYPLWSSDLTPIDFY
jgi:hypothetical protein